MKDKDAAGQRAADNYISGFNCAQSVMEALGNAEGLDIEPLVCMVTGLGGGIALQGEACGALVSGVLWLSMAHGTVRPDQPRAEFYRQVEEFSARFREKAGALDCAAINGTEDFTSDEHKRRCSGICAHATRTVLGILEEERMIPG